MFNFQSYPADSKVKQHNLILTTSSYKSSSRFDSYSKNVPNQQKDVTSSSNLKNQQIHITTSSYKATSRYM